MCPPDGKIPLSGISHSLIYFGGVCSLRVTGVDGLSLERPLPTPGLEPDTEEASDELSPGLHLHPVLHLHGPEVQARDPGQPGPASSTPCRPACVPCVPPTPPCNRQTPAESEQGSLSLEVENKVKFRDGHKEAQEEEDTAALRSKVIYNMIRETIKPRALLQLRNHTS